MFQKLECMVIRVSIFDARKHKEIVVYWIWYFAEHSCVAGSSPLEIPISYGQTWCRPNSRNLNMQ